MAYVPTPEDLEFRHFVKCDLSYFKRVLGIKSDRQAEPHEACPICGDQTGMQFGPEKKRLGEWYFHCHRCGANGDTITAMNLACNMPFGEIFKRLRQDFPQWKPGASKAAHDEYHAQRQQEIQRNRMVPPTPVQNGHVPPVFPVQARHVNGTAFQNSQSVFPPLPPATRTQFGHQPASAANRSYALPQPSFTENEQPLVHQSRARPDPVIDLDMATQFVETQHRYLLDHLDLVKKWRRGISREVIEKYRIGFGEFFPVKFLPWMRPVSIPAAWVLPITNEKGALKGVKIHCEESFTKGNGEKGPKCFWMPFGTQPMWRKAEPEKGIAESKPEHIYKTLWPHPDTLKQKQLDDFSLDASWWLERMPAKLRPRFDNKVMEFKVMMAYEREKPDHLLDTPEIYECQLKAFDTMKKEIFAEVMKTDETFKQSADAAKTAAVEPSDKPRCDWSKFIFIQPGELKALACESMGFMATAPTTSESWMAPPDLLKKFAGQAVCIIADQDAPKRLFRKKNGQPELDEQGQPVVMRITAAGQDFAAKWSQALSIYGTEKVLVRYGGQKESVDDF